MSVCVGGGGVAGRVLAKPLTPFSSGEQDWGKMRERDGEIFLVT